MRPAARRAASSARLANAPPCSTRTRTSAASRRAIATRGFLAYFRARIDHAPPPIVDCAAGCRVRVRPCKSSRPRRSGAVFGCRTAAVELPGDLLTPFGVFCLLDQQQAAGKSQPGDAFLFEGALGRFSYVGVGDGGPRLTVRAGAASGGV